MRKRLGDLQRGERFKVYHLNGTDNTFSGIMTVVSIRSRMDDEIVSYVNESFGVMEYPADKEICALDIQKPFSELTRGEYFKLSPDDNIYLRFNLNGNMNEPRGVIITNSYNAGYVRKFEPDEMIYPVKLDIREIN